MSMLPILVIALYEAQLVQKRHHHAVSHAGMDKSSISIDPSLHPHQKALHKDLLHQQFSNSASLTPQEPFVFEFGDSVANATWTRAAPTSPVLHIELLNMNKEFAN